MAGWEARAGPLLGTVVGWYLLCNAQTGAYAHVNISGHVRIARPNGNLRKEKAHPLIESGAEAL